MVEKWRFINIREFVNIDLLILSLLILILKSLLILNSTIIVSWHFVRKKFSFCIYLFTHSSVYSFRLLWTYAFQFYPMGYDSLLSLLILMHSLSLIYPAGGSSDLFLC